MEPDKMAHLSSEEKKIWFMNVTITHPQLEAVHNKIRRAIRQPAGFSFVLVHGPTGAGKTTLMERLIEQTKELFLSARPPSAFSSFSPYGRHQHLSLSCGSKLIPRTKAPSIGVISTEPCSPCWESRRTRSRCMWTFMLRQLPPNGGACLARPSSRMMTRICERERKQPCIGTEFV